jgi:competence protein ComEA
MKITPSQQGLQFSQWTALHIFAVNQRRIAMLKKIAGLFLALGFVSLTWAQQIDLNKATEAQLDGLKGIGPVLTKQVISERAKAPFKDWNDVTTRVKGIGVQKASSLSQQGVRVQGASFDGKKADTKPEKAAGKDAPATKAATAKN